MATTVSAVIINFNGEAVLADCVDSLLAQTHPPDEVVIVDNASADNSVEVGRARYGSQVRWILCESNIGFPAACNRGIEGCSGELVAILNNDIRLDERWLASLLDKVTPEWSFWASQIVLASSPDRIDSAGDGMAVIGSGFKIGHGDNVSEHLEGREVFGACAAAALYRRDLLKQLAGFDEDFFLIYEDVDLSFRARLLGHRCLYVPEARVLHQVNTSIGTLSRNYVYYGQRNSEYVFWQNMPLRLLVLYLPERICFNLVAFFYFLTKRQGWTFVKAKLAFAATIGEVRKKRRKLQSNQRVETSALRTLFERNWFKYRGRARKL